MADRVVSYRFTGDFKSLTAGLAASGRGVQDLGTKLTALDKNGAKMRRGLDQLGGTAGRIGITAAVGLGAVVVAAANFDAAMSKAAAITQATGTELEALRKAAIKAGADTKFSASEAAQGITELGKAGVSISDILGGGLTGALNLAAAGELSVAEAAEYTATALNQFKLSGDQASHVADLLAAGAGKAQGEVSDMANALSYAGVPAANLGVSIEQTAGTIALFAKNGIIGEQAGTSLRGMLASLTSPSQIAAKQMDALGIQVFDASGKFAGLDGVAEQLRSRMAGLTDAERANALGRIFGNEQLQAANVLVREGAEGVRKMTDEVNDQGYAAEQAAKQMDNLRGDLEQLRGSLETALIGAGEGSQGPLRQLTQGATDAVNAFNGLPGPLQNTATGLLAITAITGGGLWFGTKVINGLANTKQALDDLSLSAGRLKGTLGALTIAGGALATAFTIDQLINDTSAANVNEFSGALLDLADGSDKASKSLDSLFTKNANGLQKFLGTNLSVNGLEEAFRSRAKGAGLTNPFGFFNRSERNFANDAFKQADEALAAFVASGRTEDAAAAFKYLSEKADEAGYSTKEIAETFPKYTFAAKEATKEAKAAANSTETYGTALVQTANSAGLTGEQLAKMTKSMQESVKAATTAFDAETQYRQALKAAREEADKNNAGIKGDSDAALANRDALSQLASAWNNQSDAVKNNEKRYREARKAFVDTATAMGVPIGQARRLARTLLEIPDSKVIDIDANTDPAKVALDRLMAQLRGLRINIPVTASTNANIGEAVANSGKPRKAEGGPIYGPGTPTSDSIPAMLSNGEYVIRAAAVAKYGLGFFDAANQMRLAGGGSPTSTGLSSYIRNDLDLKFPRTLAQWERALRRSEKAIDRERAKRDDLVSARDDLAASTRDAFRSDLFNLDRPDGWEWMSASQRAATATNPLDILRRDISNASSFKSVLAGLQKRGLDGQAFGALAGSGDLAQAQMFAAFSNAQLADYERLYNQRSRVTADLGVFAGNVAYGKEIAESNAHLKVMVKQGALLEKRVHAVEKAVRDHAAKGKASKRSSAASVRTGKKSP